MVLTFVRVSLAAKKLAQEICVNISFLHGAIIGIIVFMVIILQVNNLLETLDLTDSAQRKGHYSLYNCLVLGHTKYNGVQWANCNRFPEKPFYGSHRLDLFMIRPPGHNHGSFVVSPDSVWYALVLLLCSATTQTDTRSIGPKRLTVHLCQRWKHTTILKMQLLSLLLILT